MVLLLKIVLSGDRCETSNVKSKTGHRSLRRSLLFDGSPLTFHFLECRLCSPVFFVFLISDFDKVLKVVI